MPIYSLFLPQKKYLLLLEIQAIMWNMTECDRDIGDSLIKTIRVLHYSPFPVPPYSEEG
jgi:hypothetical protein